MNWFGLATSALISTAAIADDLSVERVAPAEAIAVMSITHLDRILERMESSGMLDAMGMDTLQDELDAQMDQLPQPWADGLSNMMDDRSPIEMLGSMSMGGAVWMGKADEALPDVVMAGWVDLAEQAEAMGAMFEQQWEEVRSRSDVSTEQVMGRLVDVVSLTEASDEPGSSLWHLREDRWVMLASGREGMERMLDVLDGNATEESLGESEAWISMRDMLGGDGSMRIAFFVEGLARAAGNSRNGMMVSMVRPTLDVAIGKIEAMAAQMGAGEGEELLTMSGAVWMPDGPSGLTKLLSGPAAVSGATKWAGQSCVSLTSFYMDFSGVIPWLRDVARSNPMLMGMGQMLDQAEPQMQKLLNPLGDQVVSIASVTHPITADSLNSLTTVSCKNPQALSDAMAETAPGASMAPREFQGQQIWSVDPSEALPMPFPMGESEMMSMAIAGQSVLMGDNVAVEQAIRSLGTKQTSVNPWVERVFSWIGSEEVTAWGGMDLREMMTTVAEIQAKQMKQFESKLAQVDPELWEEIKGELESETNSEQLERLASLSEKMGPAAWKVVSTDTGFEMRGVVMSAQQDGQ
ncbi:MAG: hypothetical protein MK077_03950 [Phycisphaerales bacterium]|nr:hypothetical protein [Phycisphaerales bacterium]